MPSEEALQRRREASLRHYYKNKDRVLAKVREYQSRKKAEDPEGFLDKAREKRQRWEKANPERHRESCRTRQRRSRATPQGKLADNLRSRINAAIDGRSRNNLSAVRHMGCTVPELMVYLEKLFQPGMTWENHKLDGWHIDHIKPLVAFDLTDPEQFKAACHFTNLQPLWGSENQAKGSKIM